MKPKFKGLSDVTHLVQILGMLLSIFTGPEIQLQFVPKNEIEVFDEGCLAWVRKKWNLTTPVGGPSVVSAENEGKVGGACGVGEGWSGIGTLDVELNLQLRY